MEVEVVCSWCDSSMGWKDFEFQTKDIIQRPITHGICRECFEKEMAEIKAIHINNNQLMKGVSP